MLPADLEVQGRGGKIRGGGKKREALNFSFPPHKRQEKRANGGRGEEKKGSCHPRKPRRSDILSSSPPQGSKREEKGKEGKET